MDLLKDILKTIASGITQLLIPILMVIGGAALAGYGIDNDLRTLAWIGGGLLLAGLIWGALLYLFHS